MTLEFFKEINEYVIDATLEANDEEIFSTLGTTGYPKLEDVHRARSLISQAIRVQRQNLLAQKKAAFEAHKQEQGQSTLMPTRRSISEMLSDIVSVMQNKDKVPEGLLLAFREQGSGGSDEDVEGLWRSLVQLGLIDPGNKDEKP